MRTIKRIVPVLAGLACFAWVWTYTKVPKGPHQGVTVTLSITTPMSGDFELFYDSIGQGFGGQWSERIKVQPSLGSQEIQFELPPMKELHGLRIDPGDQRTTVLLHGIHVKGPYRTLNWGPPEIQKHFTVANALAPVRIAPKERAILLECNGQDPYIGTGPGFAHEMRPTLSRVRPVMAPFVTAALAGCLAGLLFHSLLRTRIGPMRLPFLGRWSFRGGVLIVLGSILIYYLVHELTNGIRIKEQRTSVAVIGSFPKEDDTQIFIAEEPGGFTRHAHVARPVTGSSGAQLVKYEIPAEEDPRFLRFDPGMQQDTIWLDSLILMVGRTHLTWPADTLEKKLTPNDQVASMELMDGRLRIIMQGSDPFFTIEEDLGPVFEQLRRRDGNGPIPVVFAAIAVLFFLFGTGPVLHRWIASRPPSTSDLFISGFFLLAITVPLLTAITGTGPVLENTEKRLLARKPVYTLESTLRFPEQFNTYYAENFGMRKLLFRWNSLFYSQVLRTSPLPDRAIFGKDGWLFYMQPGALQKYEGLCDIPDEQLLRVAERLEERRKWLAAQGILYVLMIPPEKSVIYGDKLPARIKRFNEPSCLDRLLERLKERSAVDVVDVRGVLKDARRLRDVYYTTDTHWNPVGAWFGYAALMNTIRDRVPSITPPVPYSAYTIHVDTNDQGDIAQLIGLNDVFTRVTPLMVRSDTIHARNAPSGSYASSGFLKYPPITKEVPGSKAPRLLMFRDSFAVYMIPSLSEHFSRSTYVWTPIFLPEIVAEERPDIVVHEVMELYLTDLLQDDLPLPTLVSAGTR